MTTYSTPANLEFPILEWDDKTQLWRLAEDFLFSWDDPKTNRKEKLFAPEGEEYDKASVPRPLWGLARTDGPWELPSFWHDENYRRKGVWPSGWYQVYDAATQTWADGPHWPRTRADWFLGWTAQLSPNVSLAEATEYVTAVKLYPPNWFKGF